MNHENLNKLIDWLNRGAPEFVFSMRYGLVKISDTDLADPDEGFFSLAYSEQAKVNSGCGSVCCIGGAAAQFGGMKPNDVYDGWTDIQNRALEYLGLEPGADMWMLPVFDPDRAPRNCTPQQAAKALKLWADHVTTTDDITFDPWEHILA